MPEMPPDIRIPSPLAAAYKEEESSCASERERSREICKSARLSGTGRRYPHLPESTLPGQIRNPKRSNGRVYLRARKGFASRRFRSRAGDKSRIKSFKTQPGIYGTTDGKIVHDRGSNALITLDASLNRIGFSLFDLLRPKGIRKKGP